MKKLPLVLVFLGLSVNLLLQKPADAQITKACTITPFDGVSVKVPLDPNSNFADEKFISFAYKIGEGSYRYYVSSSSKNGGTVSQTDLKYFKQGSVQKVKISVCGSVQSSPNIPYLNFKFVNSSNKVIKVKALGTQSAVYTLTKGGHTTTVQTVFKL